MRSLFVKCYNLSNPFYASVVRTFSTSEWNHASDRAQDFPPLRSFILDSVPQLGFSGPAHEGHELPAYPSDMNVPRTCAVPKRKARFTSV
jgi:hypothetical protein